jgi:hypothetical protein
MEMVLRGRADGDAFAGGSGRFDGLAVHGVAQAAQDGEHVR